MSASGPEAFNAFYYKMDGIDIAQVGAIYTVHVSQPRNEHIGIILPSRYICELANASRSCAGPIPKNGGSRCHRRARSTRSSKPLESSNIEMCSSNCSSGAER